MHHEWPVSAAHAVQLPWEGKVVTLYVIYWFFRRKIKIAFLAAVIYAALC